MDCYMEGDTGSTPALLNAKEGERTARRRRGSGAGAAAANPKGKAAWRPIERGVQASGAGPAGAKQALGRQPKAYYGVRGEAALVAQVAQLLANKPVEVAVLAQKLSSKFNEKVRSSPHTPLPSDRKNDGSFKRWLVLCGFEISPLFGETVKNRAWVALPDRATWLEELRDASDGAVAGAEAASRRLWPHSVEEAAASSANESEPCDGDHAAGGLKDAILAADGSAGSTASLSDGGAKEACSSGSASTKDELEVNPCNKKGRNKIGGEFPYACRAARDKETESMSAGQRLLTMLRQGQHAQRAGPYSEPQPLSTDEYQLWVMQAREDVELGADAFNSETFGEDASLGWSFEENVAANEQIRMARDAAQLEEQELELELERGASAAGSGAARGGADPLPAGLVYDGIAFAAADAAASGPPCWEVPGVMLAAPLASALPFAHPAGLVSALENRALAGVGRQPLQDAAGKALGRRHAGHAEWHGCAQAGIYSLPVARATRFRGRPPVAHPGSTGSQPRLRQAMAAGGPFYQSCGYGYPAAAAFSALARSGWYQHEDMGPQGRLAAAYPPWAAGHDGSLDAGGGPLASGAASGECSEEGDGDDGDAVVGVLQGACVCLCCGTHNDTTFNFCVHCGMSITQSL